MSSSVIRDVVFRTNGELYIGVVGPVRCGKSMFIRKFIETKVLPYVDDELQNIIIDDLPQSADGKAIMTVEPKFVPSNNVFITVEENLSLSIRLVDCVGYVIPSSKGYVNEDKTPRLVKTPWFGEVIPFEEAASVGTKKVIENHSHIGILLTSDGSFGEFTRSEYAEVEEKLAKSLLELDKPFVVVINTKQPGSGATKSLIEELQTKYGVCVIAVDVSLLSNDDIDQILKAALSEFTISKLDIKIPNWISVLEETNHTKMQFDAVIDEATLTYRKFKDADAIKDKLAECELFSEVKITNLDSGTGEVEIVASCCEDLYNDVMYEIVGEALNDKAEFIKLLQKAIISEKEYAQYKTAIESAKCTGYGIAVPNIEDMRLDTPEVVKQGSRYGVKLRAIAPSIHMIKVDVESTFEPIIGSEEQSKNLIDKLMKHYEDDPNGIWNSEIFGRKLSEVVNDGIKAKLYLLSDDTQNKFKESLEKVVNKGKGGIIAFIL